MTRKVYNNSKMSIKKFFDYSLHQIIDVMTENPNKYIEVQVIYCIGKETRSSLIIDVEDSELEQHTMTHDKPAERR